MGLSQHAVDEEAARQTMSAVLDTTELLEHIISFLPRNRVFVDTRVSKHWRNSILDSPSLRKHMWLPPKSTPHDAPVKPELSGTLESIHARSGLPFVEVTVSADGEESWYTPVGLNPMLKLWDDSDPYEHDERLLRQSWSNTPEDRFTSFRLDSTICMDSLRELRDSGPSYLDTFLTMPPRRRAKVRFDLTLEFANAQVHAHVSSDIAEHDPLSLRTLIGTALAPTKKLYMESFHTTFYGDHELPWDLSLIPTWKDVPTTELDAIEHGSWEWFAGPFSSASITNLVVTIDGYFRPSSHSEWDENEAGEDEGEWSYSDDDYEEDEGDEVVEGGEENEEAKQNEG